MSLSVCQEKSVCQKCQDFGNVRFWQLWKGSNYRILILIFYGRSDWQTIALLVTMLVRVDVQRDDQSEYHAN